MSDVKAVFFDYDGLFNVGSEDAFYACFAHAIGSVGVIMAEDEIKRRVDEKWGGPGSVHLEALLAERLAELDDIIDRRSLIGEAELVYNEHVMGSLFSERVTPVAGSERVAPDLKAAYDGLQLAIITGRHHDLLREEMLRFGHDPGHYDFVRSAYGLEDGMLAKPNPHMAFEAMRELGVTPDQVVSVGDAIADIHMARRAGIENIVTVGTGHALEPAIALRHGAHFMIPDVTHLPDVIAYIQQGEPTRGPLLPGVLHLAQQSAAGRL